jgi:archaellin
VSDRLQEVVTNGWIDPLTNRIYVIGITVAKAPGGRPIDLSDVVLVCTIETDLGEYTGTYRYGGTVGEPKDIGGSAVPPVGATTNTFRASVVEDNDDSSERRHVVDDREDRYKLVFALGAGGAPQLEGGEKGTVKIYNGPAVSTIRFTVPKNLQKKRRVGL